MIPEPVTLHQNEEHKGLLLAREDFFREELDIVHQLRAKQARYKASLPTDPSGAVRRALDLLRPGFESYPEGFEEALHLSAALGAMVRTCDVASIGHERDAAIFVADMVHERLIKVSQAIEQAGDALCGPANVAG